MNELFDCCFAKVNVDDANTGNMIYFVNLTDEW